MSTSLMKEPSAPKQISTMLRPSSIFEEMDQLTQRIANRAFHLFQQRGGFDGLDMNDWFRAESEIFKPVPIAVEEHDGDLVVRAEVPGFEAKELSVRAENNLLTIYGKTDRKTETEKKSRQQYSEMSASEIYRQISLPTAVLAEKATAKLENGVLEIHLPKAAPPKLIEVKAA